MCRASGACHLYTPGTQRSRAGLATDAPPALASALAISARAILTLPSHAQTQDQENWRDMAQTTSIARTHSPRSLQGIKTKIRKPEAWQPFRSARRPPVHRSLEQDRATHGAQHVRPITQEVP